MTTIAQTLVSRLQLAEKAIASTHGQFVLFVLAEREETPGKWDLLVSALWPEINRQGVQQMVALLKPYLTESDWLALASITPLAPTLQYVQWIARKYNVQHDSQEVVDAFWDGLFIPHGYVITASPSPAQLAAEPAAA
jgi:hypothetical protein